MAEPAELGGYTCLKNPGKASDYHKYLWAVRMDNGRPYLWVYETYKGKDTSKPPKKLGLVIKCKYAPCKMKETALKGLDNREEAIKCSNGLSILVENEKTEETRNVYVMLGNVFDGEMDPYYFPKDILIDSNVLDHEFMIRKYINIPLHFITRRLWWNTDSTLHINMLR